MWGGGPGGVIGSLSGLLDRSLFGGGGGGATSSRGRLSQCRLSHQLGSFGGGKSNRTWAAHKGDILDKGWLAFVWEDVILEHSDLAIDGVHADDL